MMFRVLALLLAALLTLGNVAPAQVVPEDKIIRAHGISTFGDLKYPEGFAHFDYVNPDAPKGGTFSTWGFGTFDSLTPYILKGNAATLSTIFFDSLMTGTLDEPDSLYGLLAHTIEYPESRQFAIFHLRPEARFSDGTPVTADDVVFSFEILRDKGQPTYKVLFKDFAAVEAIDPLTVRFTFQPGGALRELPMTAAGLPVFSRAYYATRDFAESTLEPPMGSGPYLLDSVDAGRSVTYKRRDDYWARDLNVNRGQSNFDRLSVTYFADYTTAFEGFKAGSYMYREEFLSTLWATGYDFPAMKSGHVKREIVPDGRPAGTQGWWFNLRRPVFADPRVRQAIGMAFNFEWANDSLFYNIYTRTDSFWENSTMQAEGMPSPAELALLEPLRADLPPEVFTEPAVSPAPSPADKNTDRRTISRAGAILDAAGWTVAADGIRVNAAGERLSVEMLNDSPSFERIMTPFIENLTRLGVAVRATRVDSTEAEEREKTFNFDITTRRYAMSQTPGIELRGIFGSEAAVAQGSANISGVDSPAVDALIKLVEDAETREDLVTAVKALDRVLRAMHIWVPQWYKPEHNIAYFDMYERPFADPPPYGIGEASIWWYNPDKAAALKAAGVIR